MTSESAAAKELRELAKDLLNGRMVDGSRTDRTILHAATLLERTQPSSAVEQDSSRTQMPISASDGKVGSEEPGSSLGGNALSDCGNRNPTVAHSALRGDQIDKEYEKLLLRFEAACGYYWTQDAKDTVSDKRLRELAEKMAAAKEEVLAYHAARSKGAAEVREAEVFALVNILQPTFRADPIAVRESV